MTHAEKFLKDLVHYRTYADTLPNRKKETRQQMIERNMTMHMDKYRHIGGKFVDEIAKQYQLVYSEKVVPSMRSFQFGGKAIEQSNVRMYNCCYTPVEDFKDLADLFYILMCGTGSGLSVQQHHICKLPVIKKHDIKDYIISDDKEGWANSILFILQNPDVKFRYDRIRKKGSPLSSGGTASGPEALKRLHKKIRPIIKGALGRKLKSIEVYDIICHIADAVVVGGVRRAALLIGFSPDDQDMLNAKTGDWYVKNPQRNRSNNSAVYLRSDPTFIERLDAGLDHMLYTNSGDPGALLTNHPDYLVNPCAEIALSPRNFCNLTEINVANCNGKQEFYQACQAASFIGTLQAGYTDFPYIKKAYREACEREALLGVSITGQAYNQSIMSNHMFLQVGAGVVLSTNERTAKQIGINIAERTTTGKPSGNTSEWLGTASGVHGEHDKHFIRHVRIGDDHEITKYLLKNHPEIIEPCKTSKNNYVVATPVKREAEIYKKEEGAIGLLDRTLFLHKNWVQPGHRKGPNTHNISVTLEYTPEDRKTIKETLIRENANWMGMSMYPRDDGVHEQPPFHRISEEEYKKHISTFPNIDLSELEYDFHSNSRDLGAACAGGVCELT